MAWILLKIRGEHEPGLAALQIYVRQKTQGRRRSVPHHRALARGRAQIDQGNDAVGKQGRKTEGRGHMKLGGSRKHFSEFFAFVVFPPAPLQVVGYIFLVKGAADLLRLVIAGHSSIQPVGIHVL